MKGLDEMIQELCPDGVEFVKIGEICDTITDFVAAGSFADLRKNVSYNKEQDFAQLVRTTDLKNRFKNSNDFVFVSESAYKYLWRVNLDEEAVILPNVGNCGEVYFVTPQMLPYKNNVLGPNAILVRSSKANNKFLSYVFQTIEFKRDLKKITSQVGQTKFNKTKLKTLEIPLPPIEIQTEIVRILDKFTALEAELEAELDCRKRQYEYYRDKLLSFDNVGGQEVEWKKMSEVCIKGSKINWNTADKEYSYIDLSSVDREQHAISDCPKINKKNAPSRAQQVVCSGDILFGTTRPTLMRFCYIPEQYDGQICSTGYCVIRVDKKKVDSHYIYHFLFTKKFRDYVEAHQKGASYPAISNKEVMDFEIPIPSSTEQHRIVTILDRFESLTTSLQSGLPAEIAARRQQYEHYRDQLLNFYRKHVV